MITVNLSDDSLDMLRELGCPAGGLEWDRLVEDAVQFLCDAHRPRPQARSIDSREQMREALVSGIDSTTTGFLSRFIGHETRKILNAERAAYQDTNSQTVTAFLDLLLQNYFKEP